MNQEGYTHTSFSKGPATSTYTNTKKRLGESDTDTEQFPKMFNVELLLTSNQAQCKPEMAGSKISEKKTVNVLQQFQQFQKRIKQMKRTILNKIEKFEQRYLKDDDEMDKTGSVQIILKEQENIRDIGSERWKMK